MNQSLSISWLASSDAEISRARGILKALTKQGVLDELGFLVLLGAISDRLYPAINTIMTRARYLVFVPAIFRYIEDRRAIGKTNAERAARDLQLALRNALYETDRSQLGIIGRDAGRDIARPPSNVYWNALNQLGIALQRISETAYLEQLSDPRGSAKHFKDDDRVLHPDGDDSFWNPAYQTSDIISKDGLFAKGTSFSLTRHEAKQLTKFYASIRPDGGISLISHLLALRAASSGRQIDFAWPWDVPDQPGELKRVTDHARRLSLLAYGAQLQYHAMLFAKRKTVDPGTREAFYAWWGVARYDLQKWDMTDFARLPCVARAPRLGDIAFLNDWRNAIINSSTSTSAYASAKARDLLQHREVAMRSHKARLRGGFYLKTWIEPKVYSPKSLYLLEYRHSVGMRFAVDITHGLEHSQ